MKTACSFYELHPSGVLGGLSSSRVRKGALLRFSFFDSHGEYYGFSDCHPWVELGDLPLEQQLGNLKSDLFSPLTERALQVARVDGLARRQGLNLWAGLSIPPSHALFGSLEDVTEEKLRSMALQGFSRLKVKAGSRPQEESLQFLKLRPFLEEYGFKVRLDFNHLLSLASFEEFLNVAQGVLPWVDFIEDPFCYDSSAWAQVQSRWQVRLALDRISWEGLSAVTPDSISVLVIKPAAQDPEKWLPFAAQWGVSTVMTTYVGHPYGQICDVWAASKAHTVSPLEACGYFSKWIYQEDAAFREMKYAGPSLIAPQGTGFGMDSFLENQNWEAL